MANWPGDDFLDDLRGDGYAIISRGMTLRSTRERGHLAAQKFFLQTQRFKDAFRTPSSHGYVTPAPGVHELFEMRKVGADPGYRVPEPIMAEWTALYDALEAIARDLFREISIYLCGTPRLLELLDGSTLRLIHYDRCAGVPVDKLQPVLSDHTDSGFITVATKATVPGLEVRDFGTHDWSEIENKMQDDDVLVFAGDCLSRVSNNHFRSILHRPSASAMVNQWPPRLSTPFFLRGRPDALLDVHGCKPALIGELDPVVAKAIRVDEFSDNVGGVRDRVPWRSDPYYDSFRYG